MDLEQNFRGRASQKNRQAKSTNKEILNIIKKNDSNVVAKEMKKRDRVLKRPWVKKKEEN